MSSGDSRGVFRRSLAISEKKQNSFSHEVKLEIAFNTAETSTTGGLWPNDAALCGEKQNLDLVQCFLQSNVTSLH